MTTNVKPVQLLYHGTTLDNAESIEQRGLVKQRYDKVYLTADIQVAYNYAKKAVNDIHSNTFQPVICIVDAPQMIQDGFTFQHNGTYAEWTVDYVPPKYILQIAVESEDELDGLAHYVHEIV